MLHHLSFPFAREVLRFRFAFFRPLDEHVQKRSAEESCRYSTRKSCPCHVAWIFEEHPGAEAAHDGRDDNCVCRAILAPPRGIF